MSVVRPACLDCGKAKKPTRNLRCNSCAGLHGDECRKMSLEECAWLGAMITADGSIVDRPNKVDCIVAVANNEVEVVATCLRFAGTGGVHGSPYEHGDARNVSWRWWISGRRSVHSFLCQVVPYLAGPKRRLAEQVITRTETV